MALITILIVLVVQRFANMGGWFKPSWFEVYLSWLRPMLIKVNKWLAIVVVMLPVFVVLAILHFLLVWRMFGVFYLLLSCAVLLLCMDARNLKNRLARYLEFAEKQEAKEAISAAEEYAHEALPHSLPELQRAVTKLIFVKSYTKIFSVFFWFGILNIYGAAGYLMLILLRKRAAKVDGNFAEIANLAEFLQNILDWVPVRLLGLTYSLVGNFMHGFSYCMKHLKLGLSDNLKFVSESGLSTLGANLEDTASTLSENEAALALIDRSLIVWIVAMVLVMIGMLF